MIGERGGEGRPTFIVSLTGMMQNSAAYGGGDQKKGAKFSEEKGYSPHAGIAEVCGGGKHPWAMKETL